MLKRMCGCYRGFYWNLLELLRLKFHEMSTGMKSILQDIGIGRSGEKGAGEKAGARRVKEEAEAEGGRGGLG